MSEVIVHISSKDATSNPEYGALDSDVDPEREDGPYDIEDREVISLRAQAHHLRAAVDWNTEQRIVQARELERLRAETERLQGNYATLRSSLQVLQQDHDELQKQNERLRAAAQKVINDPLLQNACDSWRELGDALGRDNCGYI